MGSEEINKITYRQGFVFIGKAGAGLKVHEKRAKSIKDSVSITQIVKLDSVVIPYDRPAPGTMTAKTLEVLYGGRIPENKLNPTINSQFKRKQNTFRI